MALMSTSKSVKLLKRLSRFLQRFYSTLIQNERVVHSVWNYGSQYSRKWGTSQIAIFLDRGSSINYVAIILTIISPLVDNFFGILSPPPPSRWLLLNKFIWLTPPTVLQVGQFAALRNKNWSLNFHQVLKIFASLQPKPPILWILSEHLITMVIF